MNYSNWYNGAVYDAYIGSYSGSYAMLYNIGGEWKWVIQDNDLDDSFKCGYIIEYDKPEVEQLDEEERLFKKNYMRENSEPVTNGGAETEEAEARDSDEIIVY